MDLVEYLAMSQLSTAAGGRRRPEALKFARPIALRMSRRAMSKFQVDRLRVRRGGFVARSRRAVALPRLVASLTLPGRVSTELLSLRAPCPLHLAAAAICMAGIFCSL